MATGAELNQSLTADAAAYTLTIQGRTTDGQTPEVIASYVTSKKIAAVSAARRSGLTTADATASLVNAVYVGVNNVDIANSIHLMLSARFSVASQSATIFFALYDESDGLIGITRDYTLTGDATYTDGTLFISPPEIVDVMCAAQVFAVLRTAPSSGTISIYIEGL